VNLARGTALNFIGLAAPLPLALAVIPVLLAALGEGRFGLLTLVWAVTSYFGLFDLGLGRALTLQLSVVLQQGRDEAVGPLSATALAAMGGLGLLGGASLWLVAPAAVGLIKDLPDPAEAVGALRMMSLALPFIVLTAGLRGMLEACRAFDLVNYVRIPLGLWTIAGPWLQVSFRAADLTEITAILVAGRVVGCLAHALLVRRRLPQLRGAMRWRRRLLGPLARSGGWLTVSNLVGPLMGYGDRFILGAVLSASAVAFYATPQELTSKLWILPGALAATLFPTLAARIAAGDAGTPGLCRKALDWLILALLPPTLGLALFARELLAVWLSEPFAAQSALALQAFSAGMFVGGLAQLPFTVLQSAGLASRTAWLHVLELPVFIVCLAWAGGRFGVAGAALVWFGRSAVDAALMFVLAARGVRVGARPLFDGRTVGVVLLASAAFLGLLLPQAGLRALWFALSCGVVGVLGLRRWMGENAARHAAPRPMAPEK